MRRGTWSWWSALAVLMLAAPCIASAAGLGRLNVLSTLGQPLNAEIELLSVQKGETITARLASQEVYQQAGVPFNNALTGTRVTLERRPNGQPYLKVTTPRPINEPFIELVIEMNSENGRVVRQYTALLDPPGYGRAAGEVPPPRTTTAESAPPPPATASPAPAPRVAEAPLAAAAPPRAPASQKPSASAGAKPTASAREKQYGPVKPGETLSGIARNVRPEGVTLEQTLVSLYQRNPDAFINRNMNLIKSGKVLAVPEAQEIAAVARGDAAQEVRMQVADFDAYRNRVADRAVSVPESGSVRSGRIEPRVAESGPAETPRDRVRVSRGEPAGKGAAVSTNIADRVRALEEEVIAREKALAEANERIAHLERIIKDTQRAIELKSSTMAAAQQAGEKAALPSQTAEAPAAPPAKAPEQTPRTEAPAPTDAQKGVDAAKDAASTKTPPPAPKAQAQAPAPPEPAAQPDFMSTLMEEPLYLAAAGAVVVLGGIGLFLVRKRRNAERSWADEDDDIDKIAPTLGADEAFPADETTAARASAEPVVPRAPAERPKAAPPDAMAGIVAALASARTESAGEDNDLDFHGRGEQADSAARSSRPAAAAASATADAKSTAVSAAGAPQVKAAQPAPARPLEPTASAKAPGGGVPDFLLHERSSAAAERTGTPPAAEPFTTPAPAEASKQAGTQTQKMDFDFDLVPSVDSQKSAATTRPNLDFKLDLDDLNLNAPAQRAGDTGRDDHWHDVQQKFDLAKAYEDMGDKQGARDILQEVIREGDTAQQVQARRRLESLS